MAEKNNDTPSVDNQCQQLIEKGIKNGQYPKRLYKYRSLTSAIRSLRKPSIYMSSIWEFNDPYEGHYVLDGNNSATEWENFISKTDPTIPSFVVKANAIKMESHPIEAKRIIDKEINDALLRSGVFCFSKKNKSIPMWSYYSEDHKGICVEYDPLQDKKLCDILLPVNYSDKYVKFNYLLHQSGPKDAITQKSSCWKHEGEYRLIKIDKADEVVEINPKAITSIILGCRFEESLVTDKKRKKRAKSLLKILKMRKFRHIVLKQCVQRKDKYALLIKKIPLSKLADMVK